MARYALFICLLMLGCAARPFNPPGKTALTATSPQIRIRHVHAFDVTDLQNVERLINLKFALDEAIAFHADEIRVLNASINATQEVKGLDVECVMLTQQVTALSLNVVGLDIQAEYTAAVTNVFVQHYLVTGNGNVPNQMIQAYDLLRSQLEEARSDLIRAKLKLYRCTFPDHPQPKTPQAIEQALSLALIILP